jgi:hypothetical protein
MLLAGRPLKGKACGGNMFEPKEAPSAELNFKQKMVVVVMDLLLLAELAFCIYLGKDDPEGMTITFLKTYIPMVIATLWITRRLIKKLEPAGAGAKLI